MKRICAHKGVQHVFVINNDCIVIRQTASTEASMGTKVAANLLPLVMKVSHGGVMARSRNSPLPRTPRRASLPCGHARPTQARKMIKEIDPTNDFSSMRIRAKKNEIIIYPEKEYLLVVIQTA